MSKQYDKKLKEDSSLYYFKKHYSLTFDMEFELKDEDNASLISVGRLNKCIVRIMCCEVEGYNYRKIILS